MQYLGFGTSEKPQLLSKTEYKEQDTIFKEADMLYSEYLEYMTLKHQQENIDDYVVWQTGMNTDDDSESNEEDDKKESEPCGQCTALEGQIFHTSEVPKQPHPNCKCGVIPLRLLIGFEKINERLKSMEEKIKKVEKFKKSEQLKKNIKEAKKMQDKSRIQKWGFMLENFPTGAKYDIKHGNPSMEHAGNFNYGAMWRALGLSAIELKAGAGAYQVKSGTSDLSFYDSWGDDPVDQEYIQEGIDWYDANYGG